MSGHSKWSQIKHKKAITDKKKGALFSKLLNTISIAARNGSDPDFNPTLRSAIEQAKNSNVPLDKIQRAIKRVSEEKDLSELLVEAYGPEGVGIIIQAVTPSTNRTMAEIKKILSDQGAQFANPGSVRWSFNPPAPDSNKWIPKFPQSVSDESRQKITNLIENLEEHEEVAEIYTTLQ